MIRQALYTLLVLSLLTLPCDAKSDKRCGSDSFVPFTGFKIQRQYKISGLPPTTQQFLILYHCTRGQVDYEKPLKQQSVNQIQWETPFCFFKPKLGSYLPDPPDDTARRLANKNITEGLMINSHGSGGETDNPEVDVSTIPVVPLVTKLKNYLIDKKDKLFEKLTKHNTPILYTGKLKHKHIQDIETSPIQASLEWESRNLVCYKLARRRKYFKRDVSFYIPGTFVGALFECAISPQVRKEVFQNFKVTDSLKTFNFKCDPQLAKPVAPLIADYPLKQWWDTKLNVFSPKFIHNIPYLSTSNPLSLRFSLTETPDLRQDTWAAKIRVNEDYDFNELDVHFISQALAKSADLFYKLLNPIDLGSLLKLNNVLKDYQVNGKPVHENDLLVKAVEKLSTDEKIGIIMSIDSNFSNSINYLQDIWDRMLEHIE